jgi:hypothetical protein
MECCGQKLIIFKPAKPRTGSMLCTECGSRYDLQGNLTGRIIVTPIPTDRLKEGDTA